MNLGCCPYLSVPEMRRHIVALAAELECDDLAHCVCRLRVAGDICVGCVLPVCLDFRASERSLTNVR